MKRTSLFLVLSGAVALIAGCGAGQEPAASSTSSALSGHEDAKKRPHLDCRPVEFEGVSEQLEDQLEIARRSVCRYRRIEAALAAGYENSGLPCIPGQGYHYIKSSLVGTTDIREPSVLMYTADGDLNSPEWIAFQSDFPTPPSIFGQVMHADEDLPLWELHVWVWKLNSNGVFDDHNPDVTCP
jgi:hypothetical protein